ncbi:MAG: hypothetical protein IPP72_16290 [Chitinophagaceae bacterium]|nr:hypothetical protein [Chitinophagaceae bacterium]
MSFFNNLFKKTEKVECPRCLGKGFVDWADIKRLKRYLKWNPGSCAFCSGTGKVPKDRIKKVPVDTSYLSIELTARELRKLFRGDTEALNRAKQHDDQMDEIIVEIQNFHSKNNWNLDQICTHYFLKHSESFSSDFHKNEFSDFVRRVIES